jgi:hypothetical protein
MLLYLTYGHETAAIFIAAMLRGIELSREPQLLLHALRSVVLQVGVIFGLVAFLGVRAGGTLLFLCVNI